MGYNIRDVANKAGVSIATVSRVINNSSPVSEELKKRVNKAIHELGFRPNTIARSMRNKRSLLVGMILPDISNPFFPFIARGAEDALRKHGISLIIVNSDQNAKLELEAAVMMLDRNVDGVLFTGSGEDSDVVKLLREKTTTVFLDRSEEGTVTSVVSDNYSGMRRMIEYIYKNCHRRIWYLGGPSDVSSSIERKKAILDFCIEYNDVEILLFDGEFNYEWGLNKTLSLLKTASPPDAIVCANDLIALGAIDACKNKGFRVPEDISITGFDDISFAKHFNPPLTTIHQPIYKLGFEGASLLVEYLKGRRKRPITKVLEVALLIRKSVKNKSVKI